MHGEMDTVHPQLSMYFNIHTTVTGVRHHYHSFIH
jgi:hypothetical protein